MNLSMDIPKKLTILLREHKALGDITVTDEFAMKMYTYIQDVATKK